MISGAVEGSKNVSHGNIEPMGVFTPLVIRVPIRVMCPLILSDRRELTTSVEPGSMGARRA